MSFKPNHQSDLKYQWPRTRLLELLKFGLKLSTIACCSDKAGYAWLEVSKCDKFVCVLVCTHVWIQSIDVCLFVRACSVCNNDVCVLSVLELLLREVYKQQQEG
jgi:hypothetical protein